MDAGAALDGRSSDSSAGPEQLFFFPTPDATHRLALYGAGDQSLAVVLPLDQLFDHRAGAAIRLWRSLRGLKSGPDPMPLTRYARRQLILVLRALDAAQDGAYERDIAGALFNRSMPSRRAWLVSDHYARLRRLLIKGRALIAGGYRQILCPPPRRPRGRRRS